MFFPNAAIHRKFSNLMQRILVSFQVELDCIDQKLFELDEADNECGILRFLPFDRNEFLDSRCGIEHAQQASYTTTHNQSGVAAPEQRVPQTIPTQTTNPASPIQQNQHTVSAQGNETSPNIGCREKRAHLMRDAKSIFKEYHHFISMNNDFQSMRRVSRKQHRMYYLDVRRKQLPDRTAHHYLRARDDFVNTDRDTVHQWFEYILYSTWPCIQRALSIILFCFYERKKVQRPADDGTGAVVVEYQIRVRRLKLLQKLILAFTSAVMLLIPVGLLHFYADSDGHRGKLESFIIACASTIVFVVVITCLETNYGRALVGLCAFVAVLASFLANLSGNGAC
ncbi:hypothetical protein PG991_014217 [Apiospora marii]|uniref:DUF6594 domain-containing protein n=1 Tax=Apiospora marii TaxID=335849 RepID=A0ABR1R980_9PEZI